MSAHKKRPVIHSRTKAVVFDFDGVIIESADIKTQAFLDLFADHPEHRSRILRHHLDNLGISRYRKFEWIYSELFQRPLGNEEKKRLGSSFSALVLDKILICDYVRGARESLEALRSSGHVLFVASGTPQDELEVIVEKRGLDLFFREIWGTPRTKVEIIESILARFELDRAELVFVGDAVSDFTAASEVGVPFIARDNGTGDVDWRTLGIEAIQDLTTLPAKLNMRELATGGKS